MTFREWAVQYLIERGVGDDDAAKIVADAEASTAEGMGRVWSERTDGYPASMRAVLTLTLNRTAVAWIEKHCPLAWYKPMFDGTAETLA